MDIKDLGWERLPTEHESGDYHFNGRFLVSQAVDNLLSQEEQLVIYADIKNLIGHKGGQDYLQVYVQKEHGHKLFLIDNVTKHQLDTGEVSLEDHYCTLLFDYEY